MYIFVKKKENYNKKLPPISSTATTPAKMYKSAYVTFGCFFLIGSKRSRAIPRPEIF